MSACGQPLGDLRCRQPVTVGGMCRYHWAARSPSFVHDRYYHRKIVLGLIAPGWGAWTLVQERALFDVRAHRDGRPSDQWRRGVTEDVEVRVWGP